MNEQEQRVAICEHCKWREQPTGTGWYLLPDGTTADPLHDLNAMAQAEKTLTPDQRRDYFRALEGIREKHFGCIISFAVGDATASQRAEAFLRTLSKWRE